MVFMVGNVKIAIEVTRDKSNARGTRNERIYREAETERHVDQVRSEAMRNAMLFRLR
ncbi:MAG: hypothetical protein AB1700_05725 [Bacillota bacterium]